MKQEQLDQIYNKRYAMDLKIRPVNGLAFCIFYSGNTILIDKKTLQVCDSFNCGTAFYVIECIKQITKLPIKTDYMNRFGIVHII